MRTCNCRKLRLDPYEGMDVRARMTAATRAGDWEIARDCFDELEAEYMAKYEQERAVAEQAERERDGALSAKKSAEHQCGVHRLARDKAVARLEEILKATPEEVVEAAVQARLKNTTTNTSTTTGLANLRATLTNPRYVYDPNPPF